MSQQAMNPGRARVYAAIGLVAVFAAGGFLGATTEHFRVAQSSSQDGRSDGSRRDRERRGPHELFDQLGLSPEQRDQITAIFERQQPRIDSVMRREVWPRIRVIRDSTNAEITALLTPEQRAQWAEIEQSHRRGGRGGRSGGRPDSSGSEMRRSP